MGKVAKVQAAGSASDTDALSLHTTPDDYEYDDLPSYNDSEAAASSSAQADHRPIVNPPTFYSHGGYADDYAPTPLSGPRNQTMIGRKAQTCESTARMDEKLNDPYVLYAYIMDVVRMIPPKPMIRLVGTHQESRKDSKGSKSTEQVTDFDIYLNLQSLLRPALDSEFWQETLVTPTTKAYRGSFRKTMAPGVTQAVQLTDDNVTDLKEWCEKFCADKSRLKVFRVARPVTGMDTAVLEQLISGLIRSTEYRGHINITFPTENKYVDIYSPHSINEWRTSWVRYIFYFSMLWIITWPLLILMTKWYAVYEASWAFSIPAPSRGQDRRFATVSERVWYERHKHYIKHLVLSRTYGEADANPAVVESYRNQPEPTRASTGHADVDSAISAVAGGLNIWNQIRGGHMPTPGAWGYDT